MSADHVPAVPVTLQIPSARNRRAGGERRFWKSLDELAGDAGLPRVPAPRVPGAGLGLRGPRGAAGVPEDHGSVAGPGRPHRLHAPAHREDRPLREAARGPHPRQAALLRDRRPAPAATRRACWSRATWAGPPRSRATPSTRSRSGPPTPSPRPRSSASTIPTAPRPRSSRTRSGPGPSSCRRVRGAFDLEKLRAPRGAGIRLLTGTVTSPTLESQIQAFLGEWPGAKWVSHEPVSRDNVHAGALLAFGEVVEPQYRLGAGRPGRDPRRRPDQRGTGQRSAHSRAGLGPQGPGVQAAARCRGSTPSRAARA